MGVKLREGEFLAAKGVQRPAGFQGEIQQGGGFGAEGDAETAALVAFAIAAGDAVYGQHEDIDSGGAGAGAGQHRRVQATVAVDVELVDLRGLLGGALVRDGCRAEAGDTEHGAEFGGRGTDGMFTHREKNAL